MIRLLALATALAACTEDEPRYSNEVDTFQDFKRAQRQCREVLHAFCDAIAQCDLVSGATCRDVVEDECTVEVSEPLPAREAYHCTQTLPTIACRNPPTRGQNPDWNPWGVLADLDETQAACLDWYAGQSL